MFSVAEIFGAGNTPMAAWQGYDAYGNRQSGRPSFDSFFTDSLSRAVDAYRPIYIAGYIEDKFTINDFIVRVGLRIDRYDLNQPVLKDPYSLTRLPTVGETDLTQFSISTLTEGKPTIKTRQRTRRLGSLCR